MRPQVLNLILNIILHHAPKATCHIVNDEKPWFKVRYNGPATLDLEEPEAAILNLFNVELYYGDAKIPVGA